MIRNHSGTYFNCRHTKRCVQCSADRPIQYATPLNSSPNGQQDLQESQLISRALNKWSCSSCTYDNWPTALKCIICGHARQGVRKRSCSPPQPSESTIAQQSRRSKTPQLWQHQERAECELEGHLNQLRITNDGLTSTTQQPSIPTGNIRSDYTGSLGIYIRGGGGKEEDDDEEEEVEDEDVDDEEEEVEEDICMF